ncbi:MAG: phospholipase D-like domain-containing protein, partial [bacterium]
EANLENSKRLLQRTKQRFLSSHPQDYFGKMSNNLEIAEALVRALNRGVYIKIFLGKMQREDRYSKYRYLLKCGIPVKFAKGSRYMKNHFCVIDSKIVLVGSYTWLGREGNRLSSRDSENMMVFESEEMAKFFEKEFKHLWKEN